MHLLNKFSLILGEIERRFKGIVPSRCDRLENLILNSNLRNFYRDNFSIVTVTDLLREIFRFAELSISRLKIDFHLIVSEANSE